MDTTTPPPTNRPLAIGLIIRDVIIIWVLTALGGFIVGLATSSSGKEPGQIMLWIALSNLILGSIAFTLIGCLAPAPRWRHLGFVALASWVTGLINVIFMDVTAIQWIGSVIFIAIIMGIGGGLSHLLKPTAL